MLDLTDWKNKKYKTRGGNDVVILTVDAPGEQPIVGYVEYGHTTIVMPACWSKVGDYYPTTSDCSNYPTGSSLDLVNAKTKREGWVNVFKNGSIEGTFSSKQLADASAVGSIRVACLRIEWEE